MFNAQAICMFSHCIFYKLFSAHMFLILRDKTWGYSYVLKGLPCEPQKKSFD